MMATDRSLPNRFLVGMDPESRDLIREFPEIAASLQEALTWNSHPVNEAETVDVRTRYLTVIQISPIAWKRKDRLKRSALSDLTNKPSEGPSVTRTRHRNVRWVPYEFRLKVRSRIHPLLRHLVNGPTVFTSVQDTYFKLIRSYDLPNWRVFYDPGKENSN